MRSDAVVVEDKCNVVAGRRGRCVFQMLYHVTMASRGRTRYTEDTPPSPRVSGTFGRVFTGFSSGSKEMRDAFCEVGRCFRKGKVQF